MPSDKPRRFEMVPGKREQVPVLVGLCGPSGSGKTFSALRVAEGIRQVTGGDIAVIDTEARRALHYAEMFTFHYIGFEPPHGSLDYLAAIRSAAEQGARVIVVDSMSHEHEGEGGLLELHESEVTRLAGNDFRKREAVKMLAWSLPKQNRRRLINGILQVKAHFVFCFRAKSTSRPVKREGKTVVEQMGFVPITGEELPFEMTLNAILPPGSGGVPDWSPQYPGERMMVKLPAQFRDLLRKRDAPLDEEVGRQLAEWAKGSDAGADAGPAPTRSRSGYDEPLGFGPFAETTWRQLVEGAEGEAGHHYLRSLAEGADGDEATRLRAAKCVEKLG